MIQQSPPPQVPPATVCAVANRPAKVVKQADPVFSGLISTEQVGWVTVELSVAIDASGKVASVKVVRSSAFSDIDDAVVKAAEDTTYLPRIVDCQPVESSYWFKATFNPNL